MTLLRRLRIQLATIGVRGMASLAWRNRSGRRLQAYELCRPLVHGRRALEIGGPSAVFSRNGRLPLYPLLERLDDCDFAGTTIWHGEAAAGSPFRYDEERRPGLRFICEATALDGIGSSSYDVVLCSHTLEHIANPLRALAEWKRVVRPGGHLVLVVPHVENTFDHRRPVTTLEHIEQDFALSTGEDDRTHIEEFARLCDLSRVPERLSRQMFERRIRDQATSRTVHHHVFDTDLVIRLLDRAEYRLLWVETALPFHIVAVARVEPGAPDNDRFLTGSAAWRRTSVFRRDRIGVHAARGPRSTRS